MAVGDEHVRIAAAREVLDGWAAAFNARDLQALANQWMHFPHVRFHRRRTYVIPAGRR
jgi:hypothetical protein